MERDLCRDGCVGVNLERKDEYLEQQLQRQRQKRIKIIQDGGTRRDRRKARGQRKKHAQGRMKQLREEREEEHEARALNEEMQQIWRKRMPEPLKLNGNCAAYSGLHTLVGTRIGATALRHG